ncbi:calcium transport factor [Schizosaccharomyces pombe]|uniref:Meiotic expression up-regulated protein 29 n=1 Tax=Schizosaccharomyces pombe (strain 972 / ATCC 24843) TaxID=284812 RepID=MEU29_SCHPO|nr:protein meu29 [Schizosaccharomyces pombe]O13980.1 RecName: Full=Meiotic expression up-regulated protein 29; Flags: Precursor [Schizosaccharomyces pombe 972h-]CAB11601.1 sequence orphan [Schizosaccharomyces pombe]|eukprot:NP_593809.1 protein meu29 [Schizosaccharomyces pombe]
MFVVKTAVLLFFALFIGNTYAYTYSLDRIQALKFSSESSNVDDGPRLHCKGPACSSHSNDLAICQHNQLNVAPHLLKWTCVWPNQSSHVEVIDYNIECKKTVALSMDSITKTCILNYKLEWTYSGVLLHRPWKLFSLKPFTAAFVLLLAASYLATACFRMLGYLGTPRSRFHDNRRWNEQKFMELAVSAVEEQLSNGIQLFSNVKQRVPVPVLDESV